LDLEGLEVALWIQFVLGVVILVTFFVMASNVGAIRTAIEQLSARSARLRSCPRCREPIQPDASLCLIATRN
jgi:hypothetical protein